MAESDYVDTRPVQRSIVLGVRSTLAGKAGVYSHGTDRTRIRVAFYHTHEHVTYFVQNSVCYIRINIFCWYCVVK